MRARKTAASVPPRICLVLQPAYREPACIGTVDLDKRGCTDDRTARGSMAVVTQDDRAGIVRCAGTEPSTRDGVARYVALRDMASHRHTRHFSTARTCSS